MSFLSDIFSFAGDSGLVPAVGQMYTNKQNVKMQERINERNIQEARDAEERERAYNDPSAQMERLKAAGLNPNLIYGSGTETGTLNARAATSDAAVRQNPLDKLRTGAELKMLRSQAEVAASDSKTAAARAQIANHDARVLSTRPNMMSTDTWQQSLGKQALDVARDVVGKAKSVPKKILEVNRRNADKDWTPEEQHLIDKYSWF